MFKAIESGKAGYIKSQVMSEDTRFNEDVLTSCVFEKLSYLPARLFWALLSQTCHTLPSFSVAKLETIDFWPRWNSAGPNKKTVEPDVFLQFELGDPTQNFDVIVEAKRYKHNTYQNHEQWTEQISSYLSPLNEYAERKNSLHLIAIGGLGDQINSRIKSLSLKVLENLDDATIGEAHFHGFNWNDLTETCEKILPEEKGAHRRVLRDIIQILDYAGFKKRLYFSTLDKLNLETFDKQVLQHLFSKANI